MPLRRTLAHCALSLAFLACTQKPEEPPLPNGSGGLPPVTGAGGSHDPTGTGGSQYGTGGHPGMTGGAAGSYDAGTGGADAGAGMGMDSGEQDAHPVVHTLKGPSRGSAVALSDDDAIAVVVNRDAGSVSVLALQYPTAQAPTARLIQEIALGQGSEPWQVVIGPDDTAYVVLRKDQKVVRIRYLRSQPELYGTAAVGGEPTSIALSPNGARAYVTNWADGTVSEIDTHAMMVMSTIDLNPALVATGYLGAVAARPALAHPRSLVMTNDGDGEDGDEALYVTEYYGQQTEEEAADGSNSDTRKVGIVYRISLVDRSVRVIRLNPLDDLGFKDERGGTAGCYPNQVQAINVNGSFAYVVSVCASPKGPIGVKATTTTCVLDSDCAALNLVEPACVIPFAGAASATCVDVASVKTTTAPVVSVIDTRTDTEVAGAAQSLNARFDALYKDKQTARGAQRFPLFADDIAFVPGTSVGYLTANGADAVFRITVDPVGGSLVAVGASTNLFIDLAPAGIAAASAGKTPIGIAVTSLEKKTGIVANDVTHNATLLDFNTQAVAGGVTTPSVVGTSPLPAPGSDADRVLRGKRFFNTGLARWSLRGQGWGACQSCHADGLTDNVTWYFARGPRQATSLDGSFASKHAEDQRIFNWTAIFDEVADFELNTRGISGGVGATVSSVSTPPATADRIDIVGLGHANLNGSATQAADPRNPLGLAAPPQLNDWGDIEKYMQSIRSPRAPSNLDPVRVEAGRTLFTWGGACQGCHGGEKWTISRRFYTPSTATNAALATAPFAIPPGFPNDLLPAHQPENQLLRFSGGNAAALDQILCVIRPVDTFNVAEPGVGIAELRADMTTRAQGDGNPAGEGRGYNIPSLLSLGTGAPYMHAGNARTLEALFGPTFSVHTHALAPNFLTQTDPAAVAYDVGNLVQFLLSIDEDKPYVTIPDPGPAGGSLCPTSF